MLVVSHLWDVRLKVKMAHYDEGDSITTIINLFSLLLFYLMFNYNVNQGVALIYKHGRSCAYMS